MNNPFNSSSKPTGERHPPAGRTHESTNDGEDRNDRSYVENGMHEGQNAGNEQYTLSGRAVSVDGNARNLHESIEPAQLRQVTSRFPPQLPLQLPINAPSPTLSLIDILSIVASADLERPFVDPLDDPTSVEPMASLILDHILDDVIEILDNIDDNSSHTEGLVLSTLDAGSRQQTHRQSPMACQWDTGMNDNNRNPSGSDGNARQ